MPDVVVEIYAPFAVNNYVFASSTRKLSLSPMPKFPGSSVVYGLANTIAGGISIYPRHNLDIFHETYYTNYSYCPRNTKRILTVYDMIHDVFPQSFSKLDRTREHKLKAINRADHVICISESTRRDLIRLIDIPPEKTSVIYLGHSLTQHIHRDVQAFDSQSPYLLYVGNRGGYKNFDRLLIAYASSASLQHAFDLVCFGGGTPSPDELNLIKSLGLNKNRIQFIGGDDAVLASLYRTAAAFVYSSLYEGFGIPPLEAMSYGCPVVCSNTSSLPEVVGDAAQLFDPYDTDDIRGAIEHAVGSCAVSRRFVELGYERAKMFSWDKCARDTMNVYKLLLGS